MQFECTRNDLLDLVQIVQKAVSTRSTLPILTGILFNIEDNKLFLNSTDLEMSIKCECEVNAQSPGSVVIPARLIGDVLRNLPEAVIKFNSDVSNNQIQLECEKSKFNIKVLPPQDFPKLPELNTNKSFIIDAQVFISAVKQIIKAVSRDETRPILTGILFNIVKDKLKIVATDSYRLAIKEITIKNAGEDRIKIVVPARVLDEIIKIVPLGEKELTITVSENQTAFSFGKITLISRLIEGEFPKYQQLLPESYQAQLQLNKDTLIGVVKRVSLMALNNSPIKINIADKKMKVSSQTPEVGEAVEELDIKEDIEAITIAFNAQYLLDGLLSVKENELVLEIIGPLNPALIRAPEEEDFLYLIMPVRVGV